MSYTDNARRLKSQIDANSFMVDMINEAGGIRKSKLEQSDKLGFDWILTIVGDTIVKKEYIPQENPKGTADSPIAWNVDLVLIPNAYYVFDSVRKVWMGEPGVTAFWDDEKFVIF